MWKEYVVAYVCRLMRMMIMRMLLLLWMKSVWLWKKEKDVVRK